MVCRRSAGAELLAIPDHLVVALHAAERRARLRAEVGREILDDFLIALLARGRGPDPRLVGFDEAHQHTGRHGGRSWVGVGSIVERDAHRARIAGHLPGEAGVAPERPIVDDVHLENARHGMALRELLAQESASAEIGERRVVDDAAGERQRDGDDRPLGGDGERFAEAEVGDEKLRVTLR